MGPSRDGLMRGKQSLGLELPIIVNWPTSNTRGSVSLKYPNTMKRVENMMHSEASIFLTKFEVFG